MNFASNRASPHGCLLLFYILLTGRKCRSVVVMLHHVSGIYYIKCRRYDKCYPVQEVFFSELTGSDGSENRCMLAIIHMRLIISPQWNVVHIFEFYPDAKFRLRRDVENFGQTLLVCFLPLDLKTPGKRSEKKKQRKRPDKSRRSYECNNWKLKNLATLNAFTVVVLTLDQSM